MESRLRHLAKNYFVFYAVTFVGSAVTSISSFLMIEKLTGSLEILGFALAAKTLVIALAAPLVGRLLSKVSLQKGFWLSQVLGPMFLLPLFLGVHFSNPTVFLIGIAIGSLPGMMLSLVGTSYLRLSAGPDVVEFRRNQGHLQIIIGLCFAASAFVTPWLLKTYSFQSVLVLDLVTYMLGLFYILILRSEFKNWDQLEQSESKAAASSVDGVSLVEPTSVMNITAFVAATAIASAYLLKGLPPMLAGNASMTDFLNLDSTSRQTLWAYEALAGIVGGYLYKRYHDLTDKLNLYDLGLVSSVWLAIVFFVSSYWAVAAMVFILSVTMLLTFMRVRDDYIASYQTKAGALWAASYIAFVMNLLMTVSPLVIGYAVSKYGILKASIAAGVFQIIAFFIVKLLGNPARDQQSLFKKLWSVGSKAILSFLLLTCVLLAALAFIYERHRAQAQADIWIQNISKSVISQLVEKDYVPIYGKLKLLRQTGLFENFEILDANKNLVAHFENERKATSVEAVAIKDETGNIWGYYKYSIDASYWWSSLSLVIPSIVCLIALIATMVRTIFLKRLRSEIELIQDFTAAVENETREALSRRQLNSLDRAEEERPLAELSRIRTLIEGLISTIRDQQRISMEQERIHAVNEEIATLSKQVAHDIRSPLTALKIAVTGLGDISDDRKALIQRAFSRINDIANDLLSRSKRNLSSPEVEYSGEPVLLSQLVEAIVSEKRLQYRDRSRLSIDAKLDSIFGVFLSVEPSQLSRVLSNLINNSVDALTSSRGGIHISGRQTPKDVELTIEDNGIGMSPEILARVGKQGFSHGKEKKESGSGLGLFGANEFLARTGGQLKIASQVGIGTTVTLILPKAHPPEWFPAAIFVEDGCAFIALDDQLSILDMWRDRLAAALDVRSSLICISAQTWIDSAISQLKRKHKKITVLIDYDLGVGHRNGLDIVKQLTRSNNESEITLEFILITSFADTPEVQNDCLNLGVKLLPKDLANSIPIIGCTPRQSATI